MRIVFWARIGLAREETLAALRSVPGAEIQVTQTLTDTLEALHGATGFVLPHGPEDEGRQVIAALRAPGNTVRWMHFITAGREGYEEHGWPPGVIVSYAGGGVSPGVAEHAMALLLAMARRIPDLVTTVMPRRAFDRTLVAPRAVTLEGMTVAIVGYGHIGREFARRARAFDMRVITASRAVQRDEFVDQALPLTALKQALAQADVVLLAIALTPETTRLVGEAELAACKPGAFLVNVARGPVVDQAALARALASGHLAGAAVDVTDPEPLPADDPFWDTPNLLLSPHYAGSGSARSRQRLADGVSENLRRLMAGQPLLHTVSNG